MERNTTGNIFQKPDIQPLVGSEIVTIAPMGDLAVLVQLAFPVGIAAYGQLDPITRYKRMLLARALGDFLRQQHAAWQETLVTGYDSVLVPYDPAQISFEQLETKLQNLIVSLECSQFLQAALNPAQTAEPYLHRVPVVYGGKYGPDLAEVAGQKNLSPQQVIEYHCSVIYSVYLVGFAAGYAYLGGLAPEIDLPRLARPRPKVPKGSVAIAAGMSGIYPLDMPGGWSLLGYTPLSIFDPTQYPPVRFRPGDKVQFYPIDEQDLAKFSAADSFNREGYEAK